jgi:hypothetical protein
MSEVSESYYKRYREAVKKLSAQKLEEDFIYEHFKEGAYRVILSMKNQDTRTDALSYVSECLHNGENITDRDLKGWLKVWKIEHGEPEKLTNVKSETTDNGEKFPEHVPPADVTLPLKGDPDAPCIKPLAQVHAEKEQHVNPGPSVMVSPVFVPDTLRQSPFRTAAEALAHDRDPLGINAQPASGQVSGQTVQIDPKAAAQELKERRIRLAEELLDCLSERFQMSVKDYLQYHTQNGEKTTFDVFYFGAEKLINQQKASTAPGGRVRA